jgi:hypothetical protein
VARHRQARHPLRRRVEAQVEVEENPPSPEARARAHGPIVLLPVGSQIKGSFCEKFMLQLNRTHAHGSR